MYSRKPPAGKGFPAHRHPFYKGGHIGNFYSMDKDIPGVPQRKPPGPGFPWKVPSSVSRLFTLKVPLALGLLSGSSLPKMVSRLIQGFMKVFHSLVLLFAQLFSGGAKLPVKMIAFFIAADDLVRRAVLRWSRLSLTSFVDFRIGSNSFWRWLFSAVPSDAGAVLHFHARFDIHPLISGA